MNRCRKLVSNIHGILRCGKSYTCSLYKELKERAIEDLEEPFASEHNLFARDMVVPEIIAEIVASRRGGEVLQMKEIKDINQILAKCEEPPFKPKPKWLSKEEKLKHDYQCLRERAYVSDLAGHFIDSDQYRMCGLESGPYGYAKICEAGHCFYTLYDEVITFLNASCPMRDNYCRKNGWKFPQEGRKFQQIIDETEKAFAKIHKDSEYDRMNRKTFEILEIQMQWEEALGDTIDSLFIDWESLDEKQLNTLAMNIPYKKESWLSF